MNTIEHVLDLKKLYLVWQGDNDPQHMRYKIAELVDNNGIVELRYLSSSEDYRTAVKLGFNGYPAFPIERGIHSQEVLEAFKRRLPPRCRSDFDKYLEIWRLPSAQVSDFALLGYSGAKLPGDSFSLVPCFEGQSGPFELLIEIAALRRLEFDRERIQIGDVVRFEPDPANIADPSAIRIMVHGIHIGFVPRILTNQFHTWLNNNQLQYSVIERKNGQADHPVWYVFVKIK